MKKASKPESSAATAAVEAPTFDRRVVIAACPKGSSGKSTVLSALIELYLQLPQPPTLAVFDPDTVHRTLTKIFGPDGSSELKAPHRVEGVDWRGALGEVAIDRVVRVLFDEKQPAIISVVDGVANQMGDVLHWTRSVELFRMAEEMNFRVTFVVVVDEVGDTVKHAAELFDEVGTKADYLIVRNLKKVGVLPWDGSEERTRALGTLGAVEISLRGQTLDVQKYLDAQVDGRPHSLFDATRQSLDGFVRARASGLWKDFAAQMAAAERHVLPTQYWRE